MTYEVVRVGVGVMICHDFKLLVGRRKVAHGRGFRAFPGGHLEKMETWEQCVAREPYEEAGLHVKLVPRDSYMKPFWVTNNLYPESGKHFITLWFKAEIELGTTTVPINKEPDVCEGWEWKTLEELYSELPEDAKLAYSTGQEHPALGWIPLGFLTVHRDQLCL